MTIVSGDQWLAARRALLEKEKEFTRARDELSAARRALPWERVETDYQFDGARGGVTLHDLFAGRSQLIVYHFMFGPDWEAGCKSCSFWADNFERISTRVTPISSRSRARLTRASPPTGSAWAGASNGLLARQHVQPRLRGLVSQGRRG